MLELKEWTEERDPAKLERNQVSNEESLELSEYKLKKRLEKEDYKLQKFQEKLNYNPKYYEEQVKYLTDRDATIAYLNFLDPY